MADNWNNALSAEQKPAPDYLEKITGYRSWWLRYKNGEWFITSLRDKSVVWIPGETTESHCPRKECPSNHDPSIGVEASCDVCGIHVYNTLKDAQKYADNQQGDVYGECKIWGDAMEHDNGWRAKYAEPSVIYLPDGFAHQEIIDSLGSRYGVQIVCTPNPDADIAMLQKWCSPNRKRYQRENALAYYQRFAFRQEPWHENWADNADSNAWLLFTFFEEKNGGKYSNYQKAHYGCSREEVLKKADKDIGNTKYKNVKRGLLMRLVDGKLTDLETGNAKGLIKDYPKPPINIPAEQTIWDEGINWIDLRVERESWRKRHPYLAVLLTCMILYTLVSAVQLSVIAHGNYVHGKNLLPGVPVSKTMQASNNSNSHNKDN